MDIPQKTQRSNSLSLRGSRRKQFPGTGETLKRAGNDVPEEELAWTSQRNSRESLALGISLSSSWNQKTPVRSYYHQSIHGPLGKDIKSEGLYLLSDIS